MFLLYNLFVENEEILFFLQEIWQLPMSIETTILGENTFYEISYYFIVKNNRLSRLFFSQYTEYIYFITYTNPLNNVNLNIIRIKCNFKT